MRKQPMWRQFAILIFICCSSANAADTFPLTRQAWHQLQTVMKDEHFYTYCYAQLGPAKGLADLISKAQAEEGRRLVLSNCSGETAIAPEHIFQLGWRYCKHEPLTPEWKKIEASFKKCFEQG